MAIKGQAAWSLNPWARYWIAGLAVTIFLALWEIAEPLGLAKVAYISRPSLIAKAFLELGASGEVFHHLHISGKEFLFGFTAALGIGVLLGVILGRYRIWALLLDPLLMALYTMPRMALMPMLVVWFGVGQGSAIAVVFLGAVFPILVNTAVGIREADPVWIRAIRSFGGGEWDVFVKVLLPGAVPQVMTGLRLGIGRGLLGVVVSEMYAGTEGIGHQINLYGNAFLIAELMALIAVVSLFGFLCVNIIRLAEERVQNWGKETEV